MINYIWAGMILASVAAAAIFSDVSLLGDAAMEGASGAAAMMLDMIGVYALWMGILEIAKRSELIDMIAKKMNWLINLIFSGRKTKKASSYIAMNLSANLLGMGNAATPFGVKAIEELNKTNDKKDTASDDMCMFIIVNATSVQLVPLGIIALRSATGAVQPADIVPATVLTTLVTTTVGIILGKVFARVWKK